MYSCFWPELALDPPRLLSSISRKSFSSAIERVRVKPVRAGWVNTTLTSLSPNAGHSTSERLAATGDGDVVGVPIAHHRHPPLAAKREHLLEFIVGDARGYGQQGGVAFAVGVVLVDVRQPPFAVGDALPVGWLWGEVLSAAREEREE